MKVVLADDAQPLLPDTLRDMTAGRVRGHRRTPQVTKAVELLTSGS